MSINNAHLPKPCYEDDVFWIGGLLAKPSAEAFTENLNRFLGYERGINVKLAKHCGVGRSAVSKWREGDGFPSSPATLDKIAEFLKVPVSRLFQDSSDKRSTGTSLRTALDMVEEALRDKIIKENDS